MKTKLYLILGLVLAIAAGGLSYVFWPKGHSGLVHEANPETILSEIQKLKSPLVLVNFWASWCEPCKEEFPIILDLKEKFAEKGVQVVFVSVDDRDDLPAAENFLQEQKVDFKTYIKGQQPLSFVSKIFPQWTGAVPATVIFDQDMKIVDSWEGDATFEEFEKRLQKHL